MAISLPPPPPVNDLRGPAWQDWFFKLRNYISSILTTISTSGILGPFTDHAVIVADGTNTITSLSSLGTTTQVLHGNAAGDPAWGAVDLANDVSGNLAVTHLNSGTGASSSTYWRGDGTWATPAGTSLGPFTDHAVIVANGTSNIASLSSLGTSTQVLHGNASGIPTWGAVDLANDVSGNLAVTHLNSGTSASSSTYWRGDGTWATPAGGAGGSVNPNLAHNSNFLYWDSTTHSSVPFAEYSEHCYRWYGYMLYETGRFLTVLNPPELQIIRTYSSDTYTPLLLQIFDYDDSVKFMGKAVTISAEVYVSDPTRLNTFKFLILTGEGVNETFTTHITGGWVNEVLDYSGNLASSMTSSYQVLSYSTTIPTPFMQQLAIGLIVDWKYYNDGIVDTLYIKGIYLVEGTTAREMDTKSMAVVQHECCRYKRVADLYLRDSFESHLIDMRDIPTITVGVTCTTTGTTKDTLIIETNNSSDNGVHTVTLDAELI